MEQREFVMKRGLRREEHGVDVLRGGAAFAHIVQVVGDLADGHGQFENLPTVELYAARGQEPLGFVQGERMQLHSARDAVVQSTSRGALWRSSMKPPSRK
jgi:hypothetical protein